MLSLHFKLLFVKFTKRHLSFPAHLSFFLFLLFTSCSSNENKIKATGEGKPAAPPPPKVEAYIVKSSAVAEDLELPGSIIANESITINPEISGRLTYLNVSEGKNISKGTLIAKIYDGDLKAQLGKLAVQLKVQEQTAKRYEELLTINGVSQQEYDLIVLQANNIRADMEIVRSNLLRTEIRAPFSGTLGLKMISPGAYVSPQTVITTLRQNNILKLDFTIPERYSEKMRLGQVVSFMTEGGKKDFKAKVLAMESAVSESSRSLNIRALVSRNDESLIPGAFVKVKLSFEPDTNALMIPSQAVIPQARGKKVAVFSNGTVQFQDVETAIRNASQVQIISGLKPGDTIITSGLMSLKPNGKVVIGKINP